MTREPISKDVLIVNRALKNQIDQFREKKGIPIVKKKEKPSKKSAEKVVPKASPAQSKVISHVEVVKSQNGGMKTVITLAPKVSVIPPDLTFLDLSKIFLGCFRIYLQWNHHLNKLFRRHHGNSNLVRMSSSCNIL